MVDLDLVGGSLAWNQLVQNGNFADTSNWSASASATFSVSNHVATYKAAARYGNLSTVIAQAEKAGHKLLYSYKCKSYTNSNTVFSLRKFTSISPVAYTDTVITLNTSNKDYSGIVSIASDIVRLMVFFQDNNASGWGNIEISNVMVIDLTQLFGSEIADYIYSLEQATAGAGVEWFKQYFPKNYYAYNAGAIQSVIVSGRKVVGKNLLKPSQGSDTVSGVTFIRNPDNSWTVNGTASAAIYFGITISAYALRFKNGNYKLSGCTGGNNNTYFLYSTDGNGNHIVYDGDLAVTIDNNSGASTFTITIRQGVTMNNVIFKPMFRFADTDGIYEPYQSSEYPFDSSKQLRGIPKLVDNKLSYDGDIYKADGSVTRKYGIIDLGSLTWEYTSETHRRFGASINDIAHIANSGLMFNMLCAKYPTVIANDQFNNGKPGIAKQGGATANSILVLDNNYTDAASFKTAMSGVYLVYELATPTTEAAQPYQNPQRAYSEGTEEFIDAGVSAGTRDVTVPVGNDSTYYLSDALPAVEDYADGAVKDRMTYADNGVLGAKNLLPYPFADAARTHNGITYVYNSDNSITANGTATATSWRTVMNDFSSLKLNERYILSGCPSGGSDNTYSIWVTYNDGTEHSYKDYGNGFEFVNDGNLVRIQVVIANGYTANNLKFYPMIRLATDPDPTYVPYAQPNRELTVNKVDNSVIGTVEGTNASKAWSVGERFISRGQFKEVTAPIASGEAIDNGNTVNKPIAELITSISNKLKYYNIRLSDVPNTGTVEDKCTNVANQLDALVTDIGIKFTGYVLWTSSMFLRVEAIRCNATTLLFSIFNVSYIIYQGNVENGVVHLYKIEGGNMS